MAAPSAALKQTPLHAKHLDLGARMTDFGGWDMPVQYSGIIEEHMAVRKKAGLFDVSHMGEVWARGPHAFEFVQRLVTNDVGKLTDGRALYTVMCQPDGGVVDDLLVYRMAEDEYMLVVNAANIESDLAWMRAHNTAGANLEDASEETALLALQGTEAQAILQSLTDVDLGAIKFYHFARPEPGTFLNCERAVLSRTGYTGEPGFEIYCEADKAEAVWDALMNAGAAHGLKPCGLGARDTLRLEAGFCLYGQDLDETTNPLEAGLGWLVKLDADDFIGREALQEAKDRGLKKKLVGFVVEERGIPRAGQALLDESGNEIGQVTSGSQSPVLQKGIGLGYVPNDEAYTEPGRRLGVQSRRRALQATVTKPPFHKK